MRFKLAISVGFFLALSVRIDAQFYSIGNDPASLKWNSVETSRFQIIYPRGTDSLARRYAVALECAAPLVAHTIGFEPNHTYKRKFPVVLHTYSASANGVVTWAPQRMELFTVPDALSPDPMPWIESLVIHESRHVSQMQFAHSKPFLFWNVVFGELAPGALSAVFGGPSFLEGDAVATETALTNAGRGRSADFLEYYRACFAEADYRDYWRWLWGSSKLYTPDYYTIGYMTHAGIRTEFNCPDFSARFYKRISEHGGLNFFNFKKTIQDVSGLGFKDAFNAVVNHFQKEWAASEADRKPFMPSSRVSPDDEFFPDYSSLNVVGNDLYAVKDNMTDIRRLVRLNHDGTENRVATIGKEASSPQYSSPTGKFFWSEYHKDLRWSLLSYSDIRWADADGKTGVLTRHGRFFNPMPSPDKRLVAANEYDPSGSTSVVILDADSGMCLKSHPVPDGLQITELVWLGDELFGSGLDANGFAFYHIEDFSLLSEPVHAKINRLWSHDDKIMFTSDRSGVNELYSLDRNGNMARLTSTRIGGKDYRISQDNKVLYHTELSRDGRHIYATDIADLPFRNVRQDEIAYVRTAEMLAMGENGQKDFRDNVEVSAPKNFSKFGNLVHLHSWAPFYFDYDAIDNLSFESLYQNVGLGVSGFFQNTLGTAVGYVGYHAQPSKGKWQHSGHAKFVYSGLYPVLEISASINTRDAVSYKDGIQHSVGKPLITTTLKTYVPLFGSSGEWTFGFIPSANITTVNDLFDGSNMSRVTASARAYIMQNTPPACLYPRLGLGLEAGYSARPWIISQMCPNVYFHAYGYLPGAYRTHGLRLAAIHQQHIGNGNFSEALVQIAPRGFTMSTNNIIAAYAKQDKFSFDYAFPFAYMDWGGLGPVAFVKNFELTLHGDLSVFKYANTSGNLASLGADLTLHLGNFLWIPFPTRFGISYNYNCGKSFKDMQKHVGESGRHDIHFIFGISL